MTTTPPVAPEPASPRRGQPPLPKRPKGRWFVATSLSLLILTSSYAVWNGLLRYPVRGIVVGRTIEVSPPWEAVVASLHVREGDWIQKGQLMVALRGRELEQRLAEVTDELQLAQAELEAKVTELKWQSEQRHDLGKQAESDYYQIWSELLAEQAKLDLAVAEVERLEAMRAQNALAVSDKQIQTARVTAGGQRAKIEKLQIAVDELKRRAEIYVEVDRDAATQFKPQLLRIEGLKAELLRVRRLLAEGQVRAPVSGTVAKILRDTGERATAEDVLVEIIEDGSLETVMYVPQDKISQFGIGESIHVRIQPYDQPVACRILRRGVKMDPPPPNLARFYDENERLLPIYAKPDYRTVDTIALSIGSEVRLPRRWFAWPKFLVSDANVVATNQPRRHEARKDLSDAIFN